MNADGTRYARSGDLFIAYQTVGDGPIDVVLVDQWFSNVEALWDVPPLARLIERLSSFSRVILFDQRGVGLSDPVAISALPSLEEWMDDLRAVLDAVRSERAAIVGAMAGGFMATVFGSTHPDRTSAAVLVDSFASPWRTGLDQPSRWAQIQDRWGTGVMLDMFAPSVADDVGLRLAWARYERQSVSPGAALAMIRMLEETDIREVLPAVRVPTLVLARTDGPIPPSNGRLLADAIPDARFREVPGIDSLIWAGDQETMVGEIQEFLTGVRPPPEHDRVLGTVLFTDIVGSTDRASALGDERWRSLLAEHNRIVRRQLDRFRGREIKTTGDGFLAIFDGPARGIRCAAAIVEEIRPLGVEIRAGLHTGELELLGDDIGGIAVHIGARVGALAGASEILVSSTVKDLVAGSGIEFEDRRTRELKGVPGEWRLFAVRGSTG
jgi:class 3 adenylate cyclase